MFIPGETDLPVDLELLTIGILLFMPNKNSSKKFVYKQREAGSTSL
jgi:hypothetical protein